MAFRPAPRPKLFDMLTIDDIRDRVDWDGVISRLRRHPREASWFVPGSVTVFQSGGYYDRYHQGGEGYGNDDEDDDEDEPVVGWTALHTAMYVQPPPDAVRALLVAFPPAAVMESSRGDVPLHLARFEEVSPASARALIDAAPRAVLAKNAAGATPLDVICRWWAQNVGHHDEAFDADDLDVPVGARRNWNAQWMKITAMLCTAAAVRAEEEEDESNRANGDGGGSAPSPPERRFRALHAACDLCCPPEIVRYAAHRHGGQIREVDERTGRRALSIAAASSAMSGRTEEESRALLEELLRLDPSAAAAADAAGRLPLHLAIESLVTWDGGVGALLGAEPRALRTRDTSTRMYPFMMAAVGVDGEDADLDTVFLLLRNGPEMAAGMADDPPWLRARRGWEQRFQEEKEAHRREVNLLTEALDSSAVERDELRNELDKVTTLNEALMDENADLKAQIEMMRKELDGLSFQHASGQEYKDERNVLPFYDISSCPKRQRL